MPATVALLLYPDVELLDFAGPAEVFDVAGEGKAYDVVPVAASPGLVRTQGFLNVEAPKGYDDVYTADVLVVPGGNSEWLVADDATIEWIGKLAPTCRTVLSICTGALALAKLGLLDGLTATTHHTALDRFREMAPQTTILDDARVVDNGRIVTTAGVAAGIDGALHVVARDHGVDEAWRTARYIELDWVGPDGIVTP